MNRHTMSVFEVFLLTVVLAVGLYVSYTDTKTRRISNVCTFGLVLMGVLSQGVFVWLGLKTIAECLWLFIGGLAFAFLLFVLGIWSPGDAKLFWGVSVALPPAVFSAPTGNYPPFTIVVNTFVPYFCVMAIVIWLKTSPQQKLRTLRRIATPKFLVSYGLSLLAFGGIALLINQWLLIRLDYFSAVLLFILLYSLFDHLVKRTWQPYIVTLVALVSLVVMGKELGSYLVLLAIAGLLFLVLRFFLASLGDYLFVREIDVQDLQKGHVPASIIIRDHHGVCHSKEVAFTSFVTKATHPKDAELLMDMVPQGLSTNQVAELQRLANAGEFASFGDKVKVQTTMPFAPLILAGVILTILAGGPVTEAIVSLLR